MSSKFKDISLIVSWMRNFSAVVVIYLLKIFLLPFYLWMLLVDFQLTADIAAMG